MNDEARYYQKIFLNHILNKLAKIHIGVYEKVIIITVRLECKMEHRYQVSWNNLRKNLDTNVISTQPRAKENSVGNTPHMKTANVKEKTSESCCSVFCCNCKDNPQRPNGGSDEDPFGNNNLNLGNGVNDAGAGDVDVRDSDMSCYPAHFYAGDGHAVSQPVGYCVMVINRTNESHRADDFHCGFVGGGDSGGDFGGVGDSGACFSGGGDSGGGFGGMGDSGGGFSGGADCGAGGGTSGID